MKALKSSKRNAHRLEAGRGLKYLESVAEVAALMGSPARLKILLLLAQAPRSVEEISRQTGESIANVSQHLKKLRGGGLLEVRRDGVTRFYRLRDERTALVLEYLFDIAEISQPDLMSVSPLLGAAAPAAAGDGALAAGEEVAELDGEQLARVLASRRALILDVREEIETRTTPVKDAIRIPLAELETRIEELGRSKTYYVLCRGRACDRAGDGVRILRENGFKAFRLKESPAGIRLSRRALDEVESKQAPIGAEGE